jgi:hypothetical protein
VGTENRGLSEELISYLESSKYKSGFFMKKRKHDEYDLIFSVLIYLSNSYLES